MTRRLTADRFQPGGYRLGVRAEAAAGGAGQPVQVLGGFGEFQRPGLGRAGRVRRGVHQDPPQAVHRVALAGAGQVHALVLQHPVDASRGGGLARVAAGGVVHRDARAVRQRREQPGRDPGGGQRCDEADLPGGHRRHVGPGDQLGIADQQELPGPGDRLQRRHRPDDLGYLRRPAVIGVVEHRDPAVPGHRQPGLDLLQIRAPVLGVAPARRRIASGGARIGAVQRDRGHIPVQPGHIHPEPSDRRRPDAAGDLVQMRGDRVQGTGDPVIIQQAGLDAVRLVHRHRRRPRLHPHHRRRRGQPVRDQQLGHLAVRDPRHVPDRAQLIDDLRDPQPAPELRDHRQRTQPLLQHPNGRDLRPRPATPTTSP